MAELNDDGGKLSDNGRKLIDLAMAADEPPPIDDSWGMMVSRLTGEATGAAMPSDGAEVRASRGRGWWWIGLLIGVLAIGIAAAWPRGETPRSAVAAQPASAPLAKTEVPAKPEAPAKTEVPAKPDSPPVDRLLDEAEAALGSGDTQRAMELLERHAERAPTSVGAPRRMSLRVRTLCARGELKQARDEAKAFLGAHGGSQWADAVRRSCAAP